MCYLALRYENHEFKPTTSESLRVRRRQTVPLGDLRAEKEERALVLLHDLGGRTRTSEPNVSKTHDRRKTLDHRAIPPSLYQWPWPQHT